MTKLHSATTCNLFLTVFGIMIGGTVSTVWRDPTATPSTREFDVIVSKPTDTHLEPTEYLTCTDTNTCYYWFSSYCTPFYRTYVCFSRQNTDPNDRTCQIQGDLHYPRDLISFSVDDYLFINNGSFVYHDDNFTNAFNAQCKKSKWWWCLTF